MHLLSYGNYLIAAVIATSQVRSHVFGSPHPNRPASEGAWGTVEAAHGTSPSAERSNAQAEDVSSPVWPNTFITDWEMYHTLPEEPIPPYPDGKMLSPYTAGRGRTYYDWGKLSMLEEYYDFCVPIFVEGFNFTCHFLNVGNISYFITFDDRPSWTPPCCIFGKPWLPPSPSTITGALPFYKKAEFYGREVNWYRNSPDKPDELVFGYGFYADDNTVSSPAEFFFNAHNGWVMQDFENFTAAEPPVEKWQVPETCKTAKECDLPHVQTAKFPMQ